MRLLQDKLLGKCKRERLVNLIRAIDAGFSANENKHERFRLPESNVQLARISRDHEDQLRHLLDAVPDFLLQRRTNPRCWLLRFLRRDGKARDVVSLSRSIGEPSRTID